MAGLDGERSGGDQSLAPSFVLVCSEKSAKDAGDQSLERAFQSLSLKKHLNALQAELTGAGTAFLPGVGAAYQHACAHAVLEGRWLAVFAGCAFCCMLFCPCARFDDLSQLTQNIVHACL